MNNLPYCWDLIGRAQHDILRMSGIALLEYERRWDGCRRNGGNVFKYLTIAAISLMLLIPSGCSRRQEKKPSLPPMKVGCVKIENGDIRRNLEMSGTLTFVANTIVSAEVSAQIQSIEVTDGEAVHQGQTLLIFDDTKISESANQAKATLQKDEAALVYNKSDWEKNLGLFKSGAVSQTVYDQKVSAYQTALGQVEADRAALGKAMEDLKKTKVLAPIKGLVSNRFVEKGDWIAEGGKLFQLSDYSKLYLETFLTDVDVGKLNVRKIGTEGAVAEVTVDSYPGKTFSGKLTYIQPVAQQSRLFQVRIYLDNPDMSLLQGMFARARTLVEVVPDVLRVPLDALLEQIRENNSNSVFLVDKDGKAQMNRIKIGLTDRRYAQVTEGLKKDDIVVVQGKEILSNGQPLDVTLMTETAERK